MKTTLAVNRLTSFDLDAKPVAKRKPTKRKLLVPHANRSLAAVSAGFLPVASYVIAHIEAQRDPLLWSLVGAALVYSAPTLASWAESWIKGTAKRTRWHLAKAWGFTFLLEGVMVASHIQALSLTGLAILVAINASAAYRKA